MLKKIYNKIQSAKSLVVVHTLLVVTGAHANNGVATQAANKLGGTMQAILNIMPIASRIAGVVVLIGGMWSLYQHYKSQGRDGSIAAGIAGLAVGAGLFFLGGLLNFGGDLMNLDKKTSLPT